jgi:hypothetical protein
MQSASNQTPGAAAERLQKTRRRLIAAMAAPVLASAADALPLAARKRSKKPRVKTQRVTRTYVNDGQISIPAQVGGIGPANPYPASIAVQDLAGGRVTNVTVTIKNLTHEVDREVGVMLAKDTITTVLMVRTGGLVDVIDATLTFDDLADSALPVNAPLASGRFQPTMNLAAANLVFYFPAPAPLPSGNSLLSAFQGIEANGSWRLYVADGAVGLDGAVAGGWELTITADVPKKRKKKRKKR